MRRTLAVPALCSAMLAAASAFADADHHMHVYSTNTLEVWDAMCEAMPGECGEEDMAPATAVTAVDAIRALDDAGLDKGAILSLAYWYGVPELAGSRFDKHELVRAENEWVAEQVARYPDRLYGFFSVNPLADYAVGETRYWAEHGGFAGLKLHLANSGFDFDDRQHVSRLRAVFDVVNEFGLPVVIHLRNRNPDYGYDEAALFIRDIAAQSPNVMLQLAHIGGWGDYDAQTDGAIRAFLDAIEKGALDRSRVWFDLAAVVLPESPGSYASLPERMRDIGFDRLLFGTDWDEFEPLAYREMLRRTLSLSEGEWDELFGNEAPYLRRTD